MGGIISFDNQDYETVGGSDDKESLNSGSSVSSSDRSRYSKKGYNSHSHTGYISPFARLSILFMVFTFVVVILALISDSFDRTKQSEETVEIIDKALNAKCRDDKSIFKFAVGLYGQPASVFIEADGENDMIRIPATESDASNAYPINIPKNNEVWVADTVNDVITVYDSLTLYRKEILTGAQTMCSSPFHMFYSEHAIPDVKTDSGRAVVGCEGELNWAIYSTDEHCLLHTVTIPTEYQADYYVHDIVVGPGYAAVGISHSSAISGKILVYTLSADSAPVFWKALDLGANDDVHLWRNNRKDYAALYAAAQDGNTVFKFEWNTFEKLGEVSDGIIAPHGIVTTPDEHYLYVTSITNPNGNGGLYKFDIDHGKKFETPTPLNLLYGYPHNVRVGGRHNDKLLITHTSISVSTIQQFEKQNGNIELDTRKVLMTGFAPMGVTAVEPVCVCDSCK